MEKYKQDWLDTVEEDVKEACLEALTVLVLRTVDKESYLKYQEINKILLLMTTSNKYLQKLQQIYKIFDKECKKERTIKKWWE